MTSLDDLDLGPRARDIFRWYDIHSVEQLELMSDSELLCIRNLGRNTLNRIRDCIKTYRLQESSLNLKNGVVEMSESPDKKCSWQDMELEEFKPVGRNCNISVVRVPGGWVYMTMQGCCFIPFNDEFSTTEELIEKSYSMRKLAFRSAT